MPPPTSSGRARPTGSSPRSSRRCLPASPSTSPPGEGRNAIWLVEQGWTVVATDYSRVAVERMRRIADERLGDRASRPDGPRRRRHAPRSARPGGYDLVLLVLSPAAFCRLAARAARRRGGAGSRGRLVIVMHARRNLTEGYGGPSDPAVLSDPEDVVAAVAGAARRGRVGAAEAPRRRHRRR